MNKKIIYELAEGDYLSVFNSIAELLDQSESPIPILINLGDEIGLVSTLVQHIDLSDVRRVLYATIDKDDNLENEAAFTLEGKSYDILALRISEIEGTFQRAPLSSSE